MRSHRRVVHVAVAATLLLAFAAAVSSAETFDVVSNEFRAIWPSFTFEAAGSRVVCAVTLEGTFQAASITVAARARVASVTRATVGTCSSGAATVLSETLPWTVQYSSFGGTLPNITELTLRVIGASFRGEASGLACLVRSSEEHPLNFTARREEFGELGSLRLDESAGIPLRGGFLCELGGEGHVSGSGELRSVANREGEGEHVFVLLNQRGVDLVNGTAPPIENTLRDVPLAAMGEATLVMVDRNPDYAIRLITVSVVNPERYELLNPAERCMANTDLMRGRNSLCRIQIRRRNETMMGQNTRVQITYRYPREFFLGAVTYSQEFNVTAT